MDAQTGLIPLCPTDAVPEGAGLQVTGDGFAVAVFKVGDRYFVIDDACTHGPGLLSEGDQEGEIIHCNFHYGAFNIRTGQVAAPPCIEPVRTYYTEVVDGQICIDLSRRAVP
jgi:nitrite reductase/ring-hydroxylating ferredoxin subunit